MDILMIKSFIKSFLAFPVTTPLKGLLTIVITLFMAFFMAKVLGYLHFPAVTGYLIGGVLVGPFVLGSLGINSVGFITQATDPVAGVISTSGLTVFTEIALGFIAFGIGEEFKISDLKKTGKAATVIAFTQALLATILVDIVLISLSFILPEGTLSLSTAINLGAIATATAPAATVLVINQYHAKGEVTDILLPVVALDDAIGLMVFSVSNGIANALDGGSVSLLSILVSPLCEIAASLILGVIAGLLLSFVAKHFRVTDNRKILAILTVLSCVIASDFEFHFGPLEFGFSALLVCMMCGATFCNLCDFASDSEDGTPGIVTLCSNWSLPITVLFFALSGATFDLTIFTKWQYVLIGVIYILVRAVGKYLGARFGAIATKCSPNVVKYLGITLFPQAGVALGMANICGGETLNIALFAVMIYELVAPMLTKNALAAAGEIAPDVRSHKNKANV
ncbi:MAG: cation:proton antiporter [Eubacteriales bacterium]